MKVNVFLAVMALLIGGLIYYCFSSFGGHTVLTVVEAVVCTIALVAAMGVRLKDCPRETTMFKTTAVLWFFLLLVVNGLLVGFHAGQGTVIVMDGLLLIGGILGLYFIYRASYEKSID